MLNKIRSRLVWVSGYGGYQALSILGQFLISYMTIRYGSAQIWGEVVECLIMVNLVAMIFSWGHTTYLLREFSLHPSRMALLWQESLITRTALLFVILAILGWIYYGAWQKLIYLWIWVIGTFIFQSFNPIHLAVRRFSIPVFAEFTVLLGFGLLIYLYLENITFILLLKFYVLFSIIRIVVYVLGYRKELFKTIKWQFNPSFFKAALPFFIPALIGFIQARIDLYVVAYYLSKQILGEYQVFFKVLMISTLGLQIAISPFIKTLYRLPHKALIQINNQVLGGGILINAILILLMYWLLPYIYGINFPAIYYIVGYLGIIPFYGYAIKTNQLIKAKMEIPMAWGFFSAAICNLLCSYLLIQPYGALGAIISTTIVQWLLWGYFSYLVQTIRIDNEVT